MDLEPTPFEEPAGHSSNTYMIVLLSGIVTSALTLAGVYWLGKNADDFHIMGWYANYVIPAGAIIVGIAAGSGYAIASWLTGVRIHRGLLLSVLLLQSGAYVTAEYVEYRDVMDGLKQKGLIMAQEPSFPEYYDYKARSFAWRQKGAGNQPGQPLGLWGYVFVLLGAAGFILSGLIAPAVLYAVPYCDRCQRYMKTRVLGVLPASVPVKKIAKNDQAAQEAHDQEQAQAAASGEQAVARLHAAVAESQADAVKQELLAAGAIKANEKLPKRVRVSLIWCKGCGEGRIITALITGDAQSQQELRLAETTVPSAFVGSLLEKDSGGE